MSDADIVAARQVFDFFTANGYSAEQACGIVANIEAESDFKPQARGDYLKGKPRAFGLCQWWWNRRTDILNAIKVDVVTASFADQLKGILWELHNTESKANSYLLSAKNALQAGLLFAEWYERPADSRQWLIRGTRAEHWFGVLSGGQSGTNSAANQVAQPKSGEATSPSKSE